MIIYRLLMIFTLLLAGNETFAQRRAAGGRTYQNVSRSSLQNRWPAQSYTTTPKAPQPRNNANTYINNNRVTNSDRNYADYSGVDHTITNRYGGTAEVNRDLDDGKRTRETTLTTYQGNEASRTVSHERTDQGMVIEGQSHTFNGTDYESDAIVRRGPDGGIYGAAAVNNKDSNTVKYSQFYGKDGKVYSRSAKINYYDSPAYTYYIPGYAVYPAPYYSYPYYGSQTNIVINLDTSSSTSTTSTSTPNTNVTSNYKSSYSPVLVFLSPIEPVYRTSFKPDEIYSENHNNSYYWVPGSLGVDSNIRSSIDWALQKKASEAQTGIVVGYQIKYDYVYITSEPPLRGIYSEDTGDLYAWIVGVQKPTQREIDSIRTAIYVHQNGGAEQIANQIKGN